MVLWDAMSRGGEAAGGGIEMQQRVGGVGRRRREEEAAAEELRVERKRRGEVVTQGGPGGVAVGARARWEAVAVAAEGDARSAAERKKSERGRARRQGMLDNSRLIIDTPHDGPIWT
jgi:hypothetical protein